MYPEVLAETITAMIRTNPLLMPHIPQDKSDNINARIPHILGTANMAIKPH